MSKGIRNPFLWLGGIGALAVSGVALGLPWDIDMADGQSVKAYSQPMRPLPEGVVSQNSKLSPKHYRQDAMRGSPEGEALTPTLGGSEADGRQLGKQMYDIYCYPCHGTDGVEPGPVAMTTNTPDRFPGVVALAGPAGVAQLRTDSWIYLTIRNGGANMPPYGHAMSDPEMWAIVKHIRTFDNAQFVPPTPAGEQNP